MKFHTISKGNAEDRRVKVNTVQCTIFVPVCTDFRLSCNEYNGCSFTKSDISGTKIKHFIFRYNMLRLCLYD